MRVAAWTGCYDSQWRGLIVPEAFAHPAKFAPGLIQRIYKHGIERGYFGPGSVVGDPFGGIGGGGIYAAYAGLSWVGVELEAKFVDLANQNFDLHRAAWNAHGYPAPVIIQGDSRRFSEIVGECAAICTSPPFVDCNVQPGGGGKVNRNKQVVANRSKSIAPGEKAIQLSYGTTPGQIGRLKAGELAAVITSPPYAEIADTGGTKGLKKYGTGLTSGEICFDSYGTTTGQIGTLKAGELAAVITSPPYADSVNSQAHGIDWKKAGPATGNRKRGPGCKHEETFRDQLAYSTNQQNIGNLRSGRLDAITTSPPYEGTELSGGKTVNGQGYTGGKRCFDDYGQSSGQIGNEKSESYWTAMRQVYAECHKALKPGGVLMVVVKSYVKNKRKVPLPQQTLKLLIHLGFEPLERIKAMLTQSTVQGGLFGADIVKERARKSFFRRLAEKNGSPRIDWEEVLIVRKGAK